MAEDAISAQEKCIKQLALNATKNVKYHSSQQKASQFTAEIVSQRKEVTSFIVTIF